MQRRMLLKSGALALFAASAGALPAFIGRSAHAATADRRKTLVVVFQRFGMDGLMAVTPFADTRLAALRPSLMLPRPGSGEPDARLDLGDGFGLHPAFAPLLPLYRDGQLAIVHAVGSPHNTRSHIEAQLWWESGTPGDRSHRDGWLNRALGAAEAPALPLRAVATTRERPRILYGPHAAAVATELGSLALTLEEPALGEHAVEALEKLYRQADHALLREAGTNGFKAARLLAAAQDARAGNDVAYPPGSAFGRSLREIASLIKARVGLQVAFAESRFAGPDDSGTWDTHSNQAAMNGPFPTMADDFARSVAAFWRDLGEHRDDVMFVTLTDFGRNVVENAGVGTDHGRATAMFVLGERVRGGRVYGTLPERFDLDALEDRLDLPVTTDFRSVVATLTAAQLGIEDDARVFPGWTGGRLPLLAA